MNSKIVIGFIAGVVTTLLFGFLFMGGMMSRGGMMRDGGGMQNQGDVTQSSYTAYVPLDQLSSLTERTC